MRGVGSGAQKGLTSRSILNVRVDIMQPRLLWIIGKNGSLASEDELYSDNLLVAAVRLLEAYDSRPQ